MAEPKLPRTPEAIRAKVLEDPNTAQIARNLGLPLEEYVKQVVHFVMNPKADPSLYVVDDDDLKAMGQAPADEAGIARFITQAATVAQAAHGTGFQEKPKKLVELPDSEGPQEVPPTSPELKAELERALKGQRRGR